MNDLIARFMSEFNELMVIISHRLREFKFKDKKIGSDVFLLNFIGANPNCNMTDISNYLKTIPSTATRKIEKLVSLGLVKRISGKTDRRSIKLQLTPQGQTKFSHYLQKHITNIEELMKIFSSEEIETFLSILDFLLQKQKKKLE